MLILLYLTDLGGYWFAEPAASPVVVISAKQQRFAFRLPLNLPCCAQRKPINTCVRVSPKLQENHPCPD